MRGRNPLRHKGQHNRQGCSLCGLMKGNRGRRMEEGRKWVENSACNYAKGKWRKNKKQKNESPTNYGKKRKFQTGNGGSKNFVMGTSQFLLHTFLFLHFFASYCSRSCSVSVSVSVPISACVSLSASYVGSNNFCSFLSSFMGQRPTEL